MFPATWGIVHGSQAVQYLVAGISRNYLNHGVTEARPKLELAIVRTAIIASLLVARGFLPLSIGLVPVEGATGQLEQPTLLTFLNPLPPAGSPLCGEPAGGRGKN